VTASGKNVATPRDLDKLYKPRGPVSEALSSYYVQHVVQSAIDSAFRLAPAPVDTTEPSGQTAKN